MVVRAALVMLLATACTTGGSQDTGPSPHEDVRRATLAHLSTVIADTLVEFETATDALVVAAAAWQSGGEPERAAAQDAWDTAMAVWQRLEVMEVGPAGVMGDVVGGEDLGDEIYSWPVVNACRVDQETLEGAYADAVAFDAGEAINVKGLDALEYLLFHTSADNACNASSAINDEGTWATAGEATVQANRRGFGSALAGILQTRARQLREAWTREKGWAQQLATAGNGSTEYGSSQDALNAISDAMFYLEKVTKDMKLAEPTGISECDAPVCPEKLESQYAHRTKEHVLANLAGFEALFSGQGENPTGMFHLLVAVGAEQVADGMKQDLAAATAAVEAVPESFDAALTADPESMKAAYEAVRALTTRLKTEMLSVLDLELPARIESDND